MQLLIHGVSFTYDGSPTPLLEDLSACFPEGWTGVVGPNGAGKTTLLRLACGELEPGRGSVHIPGSVVYCPQRTDSPPDLLESLLAAADGDACRLRGMLGLQDDWLDRWDTLSDGERKRAQIGVALWQAPRVLAVDEPTNHIDAQARDLLAQALRSFRGVGLLVSHDRELLDTLCGQCLFLEPPEAVMRPGGYTQGSEQARLEEEHARAERERARRAYERLRQELADRRREAMQADRKRSKRGLSARDSDAREKLDMARVTSRDARAGQLVNQLSGRLRQAHSELERSRVRKEYRLSFWLPGSRARTHTLFHLPPGEVDLGSGRRLIHPELAMGAADRVAVTGPNGAGKTTLLRRILSGLRLPPERVTYLPQEITAEASRRVLEEVADLPHDLLGHVMGVVSGLGSRPQRLLESEEPSPGEVRKLLLARGIARSPYLVAMDEPTNHLDLPAIECLEEALDDCPCGLLLISHDLRFLRRLARVRWRLEPVSPTEVRLRVTDLSE